MANNDESLFFNVGTWAKIELGKIELGMEMETRNRTRLIFFLSVLLFCFFCLVCCSSHAQGGTWHFFSVFLFWLLDVIQETWGMDLV